MLIDLFQTIYNFLSQGFNIFRLYGSPTPDSFSFCIPFADKLGPLIVISCVFTGLHLLRLLFNTVPNFVKML